MHTSRYESVHAYDSSFVMEKTSESSTRLDSIAGRTVLELASPILSPEA